MDVVMNRERVVPLSPTQAKYYDSKSQYYLRAVRAAFARKQGWPTKFLSQDSCTYCTSTSHLVSLRKT